MKHRCGALTKAGTPCRAGVVVAGVPCYLHCPDCAHIPYDPTPGVGWQAREAHHRTHRDRPSLAAAKFVAEVERDFDFRLAEWL